MYYLLEWPDILRETFYPSCFFTPSNERDLIALISSSTVTVYHTKTQLLTAQYERSSESLEHYGTTVCALWKPDTSLLVLGTNKGFLLLLSVEIENSSLAREYHNTVLNLINPKFFHSVSSFGQRPPAISMKLMDVVSFTSAITCMDHYFQDMIVATSDGKIHRLTWSGKPVENEILQLNSVLFYFDLEHTKAGRIEEEDVYCVQMEWAPTFNGLFVLLNTGKGALLCLPSGRLDVGQVEGIWASHLKFASCMTVNFRYRTVAFGGRNGEGAIYVRDDASGSLQLMQRLKIPPRECPDASHLTGGVRQLSWSPDWSCLVMVWERGGFSLWSPFGSLMFSTLGERVVGCRDLVTYQVTWGAIGYSLWCLSKWDVKHSNSRSNSSSFTTPNTQFTFSREQVSPGSEELESGEEEWRLETMPHLSFSSDVIGRVQSSEETDEVLISNELDKNMQLSTICNVFIFHVARSALTTNPTVSNHNHLLVLSHSNLYVSCRKDIVHGKCFQNIPYPQEYVRCQWPIRFGVIDEEGERVAIAGTRGCAHCKLSTRKWKLFGNETQERDMEVVGGLAWWKEFLLVACYSHPLNKHQLRGYPSEQKLDDSNCSIVTLDRTAMMMNTFRDTLLLLSMGALVSLYDLKIPSPDSTKNPFGKLIIKQRQIIDISSCIDYPVCVIAITLTTLRSEIVRKDFHHKQSKGDSESFLINYAGRVLLFQRDRSGNLLQDDSSEAIAHRRSSNPSGGPTALQRKRPLPFCAPVVVASGVELMWCTPFSTHSDDHPYEPSSPQKIGSTHMNQQQQVLTNDTLWLNCGAQGMRVWLPLHLLQSSAARGLLPMTGTSASNSMGNRSLMLPAFMSRRIMLPFHMNCYPLVVLVEEALLIGIVNDFTQPLGLQSSQLGKNQQQSSSVSSSNSNMVDLLRRVPYAKLDKYSEIYLHQVIKQLLRKNLGVNALELSQYCRHLTYFPHVLELLLHEILEEEATSKEPIPDALLPRVVAFIQEFPEFLDTVAHCARKTEVALWPHLFSIIGQPKELFESCLLSGELNTAGSYLIILQNMEKAIMSKQHALLLLSSALENRKWRLAEELIRFLQAIDPRDLSDSNPELGRSNYQGNVQTGDMSAAPSMENVGSVAFSRSFTMPYPDVQRHTADSNSQVLVSKNRIRGISGSSLIEGEGLSSTGLSLNKNTAAPLEVALPTQQNEVAASSLSVVASPQSKRNQIDFRSLNDEVTGVLHRHARHLLMNFRVYELAEFAANTPFHDHQFIGWLRKENERSGSVSDYVRALLSLHRDFEWPLPIFINTFPTPSSMVDPETFAAGDGNNYHLFASSLLSRRKLWMHQLQQEQSKYEFVNSNHVNPTSSLVTDEDVFLAPLTGSKRNSSFDASADSHSSGNGKSTASKSMTISDSQSSRSLRDLELMSLELANRGTEKAQVQLKYLRHMFSEAQCWDWCILIDVVLRDLLLLTRDITSIVGLALPLERPTHSSSQTTTEVSVGSAVNSDATYPPSSLTPSDTPNSVSSPPSVPINIQTRHLRIRQGMWQLHDWALSECVAYMRLLKPLLAFPEEKPLETNVMKITNPKSFEETTAQLISRRGSLPSQMKHQNSDAGISSAIFVSSSPSMVDEVGVDPLVSGNHEISGDDTQHHFIDRNNLSSENTNGDMNVDGVPNNLQQQGNPSACILS